MKNVIAIAADHGGFLLKEFIKKSLIELNYEVLDLGAEEYLQNDDFPDYAVKLAMAIKNNQAQKGILICGTGIGMSIAVNRFDFIRGALVNDTFSARLSRLHNDANVIVLGARVIGDELALECVKTFLTTDALQGKYQLRMNKIGGC